MKKYILFLFWIYLNFISSVFSDNSWPTIVCEWLPWCNSSSIKWKWFFSFIGNIISEMINYTAVISVIALIIAWIMYITSGWEDEQVKKAKKWIIWSLVWVFISTSAWALVNLVNSLRIN